MKVMWLNVRRARNDRLRWAVAAALSLGTCTLGGFVQPDVAWGQQLSQDEQAALLLNAGRRAYNDRNYTQAAASFREFVQKFPAHADLPAAQYGLGLALLDGPGDIAAAADALGKSAAVKSGDQPGATYFHGVALRGLGEAELKAGAGKPPPEIEARRNTAVARFAEAEKQFTAAAGLWAADTAEDKAVREQWVARSLCDAADAALRAGRHKEAGDIAGRAIDAIGKLPPDAGTLRPLALYLQGQAKFAAKDYVAAGKALSQLVPFEQDFGPHARYLLARVHQLSDERPEAVAQFKEVAAGVERTRNAAKQALQQGGAALPADRRTFLEGVANGPLPDFAARATFYHAVLLADDGKYPEAKELFAKFVAASKDHLLASEAQLRMGHCQLQSRQYQEAVGTLTPLKDHPRLGDQASWWLAKAQLALADPNNADAMKNAAISAAGLLRSASDRAAAAGDSAAKARRIEILMDLADALAVAGQHRESATVYQTVAADNTLPDRAEEAHQRYCTALHLAGAYVESDGACGRFEQKYPKSTLLPAVWFRSAENAFFTATAALENPQVSRDDRERLLNNAVTRYGRLIEKYPEFAQIHLARLGLAQCYDRLGKYDQVVATLVKIPEADRNGDLALASYLHGDALVRSFPPDADDAVRAAGLIQSAEQAARLFEGYASGNPKSPLVPEALLKRGYCYQRMAGLLLEKPERDKAIQLARESYEKHQQQFRDHPTNAAVVFERAKLLALQGDIGGAIGELRRFQQPPLSTAGNAPLAAIRLASLLRSQQQPKEAAELLAKVRAEQEPALLKDPTRADWVPLMAYEQAMAIKEQNKPVEARTLFTNIADRWPDRPEGLSAAWRGAQCRREELAQQLAEAKKKLYSATAAESDAARQTLQTVAMQATIAQEPLARLAGKLVDPPTGGTEPHLRVLYEMAWCSRTSAEAELEMLRHSARKAAREKAVARQGGKPAAAVPMPDVALSALPPAESERKARERYEQLVAANPNHPLTALALFELSELVADRGDPDKAIDLLNKALLVGPQQELAERIRLRLAACFLARGDGKTAEQAARPVADTIKPNTAVSAVQAEARFLMGEAAIQQQDWPKAIERLTPFRDQAPFQNVAGVSDRALLRLGQAYAQSQQWDASRAALDLLTQRFAQSVWVDEARFGIGFAMQNKSQFDEAAGVYQEITRRTAAEVAARAQVHIGLCRIAQKRFADATTALLAVPYLYDYPEWNAAACYEAARAYKELQKPQEAAGLWKRVIDEYPQTKAAPLAKARLEELK